MECDTINEETELEPDVEVDMDSYTTDDDLCKPAVNNVVLSPIAEDCSPSPTLTDLELSEKIE